MTFKDFHWYLKDCQITYSGSGFSCVAVTDVPCHLFMRVTLHQPWKHRIPSPRRGLYTIGDIRFCFVVYFEKEQEEAGDTLTHTWTDIFLNPCHTLFFYFHGTINGVVSLSESPVFMAHRALISWLNLLTEPWTCNFIDAPDMTNLLLEPWTCNFVTPPDFDLLVTEPWTCFDLPAPDMVLLVTEEWSS